ncbi:hypothetical protein FRC09_004851 [Ceratobasidium sp. 395]|nr:hypothetical protein FRC09_004851 [Ceratobasidium sp. 395]
MPAVPCSNAQKFPSFGLVPNLEPKVLRRNAAIEERHITLRTANHRFASPTPRLVLGKIQPSVSDDRKPLRRYDNQPQLHPLRIKLDDPLTGVGKRGNQVNVIDCGQPTRAAARRPTCTSGASHRDSAARSQ